MSRHTIRTVDPDEWDALVERFPDRMVFHTRGWLETLVTAYGQKMVLAAAFDGDRCVAAWPCLQRGRRGVFRVIGSPLPGSGTVYMGPLFAPQADSAAALDAFLSHRCFRRYVYFSCRAVDRSCPVDLGAFGFSFVRRLDTYWLDLRAGEGQLWRNLKGECRNRIRKAERLGIEIRRESDDGFVDDFWRMSLETFARSGMRPTHNRAFAASLYRRLDTRRLLVLSAFHQRERIAMLVLPCDDRTMYYWGGAGYARARHLPAANLLHWEAAREGVRRGLAGYDLISTNGGPGRFKKTFGPTAVHVGTHWERIAYRPLRILKHGIERYQRRRLRIAA
jgi:hypothetical protein